MNAGLRVLIELILMLNFNFLRYFRIFARFNLNHPMTSAALRCAAMYSGVYSPGPNWPPPPLSLGEPPQSLTRDFLGPPKLSERSPLIIVNSCWVSFEKV